MSDIFDPRTIGKKVYEALLETSKPYDFTQEKDEKKKTKLKSHLREQYSQSVELYTYLATWGLLRLKAEEKALKEGKQEVVKAYFDVLESLSDVKPLKGDQGLATLTDQQNMTAEDYLGLTGLGLQIAREFSFWASAVYSDIKDTSA